ncbi:AAA family ATPase [Salipiger marinus]|uniref:AAA family ATPase n=1 Tax=Salipiger marinus TaxID=555512 RepID=UPI0040585C8B
MKHTPLELRPDALVGQPQTQPVGTTPHISLHAFCETAAVAASMGRVASDRRLSRARVSVTMGGIAAATSYCSGQPTPDVMILENGGSRADLLAALADLAPVCDPATKVIVVGATNDIALYRELVAEGVAEYLLAPVDALALIGAVLRLFPNEGAAHIGKIHAVIGTKGGVGSSVLAQNLAWTMSQGSTATLLADLDLQFGTVALNCNIECHTGFADQLPEGQNLDGTLLERLLFKHGPDLSILPCATAAQIARDPDVDVIRKMLDLARATFPHVVLDLPNAWSPLVRSTLVAADNILLVAEPDLANLRNARGMLDFLKMTRPNDDPPQLILNRIGLPKRREIKPEKFAAALETDLAAKIAFDPALFSSATANGQMIEEVSKAAPMTRVLQHLAEQLTGRTHATKRRGLGRLWGR